MEEKIIQYELVTSNDNAQVTSKVNYYLNLNQGWKPLGGVAVTQKGTDGPTVFAQAMVRTGHSA
jgi:hypothetical protein